ncbi:MAG TPA: SpoIIE family protein phosphatase [Tepidisphaeraceae bacterium]|jgi:serine phosphatase RsbU (regulator of sigma subunit)|nr:SpoIIE family protein phosphatase [Tepidisphaeraceae bacterium]
MRIGTKILLLMLLITIGSSAIVAWIVTLNVTSHETERADAQISHAIARYLRHLDDQHQQVSRIVRALLEAPTQRSLLQAAGDSANLGAREQLRQEVLGRDVQSELQSREGSPAFHVLLNLAHEVVLVSSSDNQMTGILSSDKIHWPVDAVLTGKSRPIIQYIATPAGLFLAMGVPLRTQLDEAPDNAYFVGFRIDDNWVRQQLLAEQATTESAIAPLAAWFFVDDSIVARASSDAGDTHVAALRADTPLRTVDHAGPTTTRAADHVEFDVQREHFLGQSFNLKADNAKSSRLVLASSLDRALAPLRSLQRQIVMTAVIACLIAIVACRFIASIISRPIRELVDGTRRIAAGQFERPVQIRRRDELGTLADSFNEMAQGLKERDGLREERVKIERDLALARKIQMDVLPKELPTCPGYDMAAFSHPAEQTGGDIYDLIAMALDPVNPGEPPSLVLLLADATGHGIGPALSVTQVRSMLRIGVRLRAELEHVFSQINRQLCQDLGSERFVTAFLGLLDPSAHHINYHSAGQAPLLHFHAQTHRFEWLDSSMIPFGIDEEAKSDGVQRMQMEPGDLIVLLTDGFYEYQNTSGELFGQERISEIILRHHHEPARTLLNEILAATQAFAGGAPQLDDMTGVIIRRLP